MFSFGIVCYELFHRRLIISSIIEKNFGASSAKISAAISECGFENRVWWAEGLGYGGP